MSQIDITPQEDMETEWLGITTEDERMEDDAAVPPIEDDDEASWDAAVQSFGPYEKHYDEQLICQIVATTQDAEEKMNAIRERVRTETTNHDVVDQRQLDERQQEHRLREEIDIYEHEEMCETALLLSVGIRGGEPEWLQHDTRYIWQAPGPRIVEISMNMVWDEGYLRVMQRRFRRSFPMETFKRRKNLGEVIVETDSGGDLNFFMITSRRAGQGTDLKLLRRAICEVKQYLCDNVPGTRTVYVPRIGREGEWLNWPDVRTELQGLVMGRTEITEVRLQHPPLRVNPKKKTGIVKEKPVKIPKPEEKPRKKGLLFPPKNFDFATGKVV
jgi:hypothetical protein